MEPHMAATPTPARKASKVRSTQQVRNLVNLNFPLSKEHRAMLAELEVGSISALVESFIKLHLTTSELPDSLIPRRPRKGTPRTAVTISREAHDRLQEVADNAHINMSDVVSALVINYLDSRQPQKSSVAAPLRFQAA